MARFVKRGALSLHVRQSDPASGATLRDCASLDSALARSVHWSRRRRPAVWRPLRHPDEQEIFALLHDLLSLQGMRDADIRRVLRQHLEGTFNGDGTTMIIEELGLCRGTVRVDIAVVNGVLKGYEIKSDQDTLLRLSSQAETYNRIFDTMTVVVAERHLRAAERLIPSWWAIQVAKAGNSSAHLKIEHLRGESTNPNVDPGSLVQLLWRDEVLELLCQIQPAVALKSKPRRVLWETLATAMPLPELKTMVCARLRSRSRWRLDAPRTQDGETSQPCATSSGSLYRHVLPRSHRYTDRPN